MALLMASSIRCVADNRTILEISRLAIEEGEHVLLQGPSGSGKTTLMSVLAGLYRPDEGQVFFRDQDLTALSGEALDRLRGARFGFVMQGFHLIRHLSVMENLALARYTAGLPPDTLKIKALLERLDLSRLADTRGSSLSMGEAQRVAVARALVNDPQVIFADEPTSALDDDNAARIIALLTAQARALKAALIVASHDARIKGHFPRVVDIAGGRVAA